MTDDRESGAGGRGPDGSIPNFDVTELKSEGTHSNHRPLTPNSRLPTSDPWPSTPDPRLEVVDLRKSFITPAGERLEILRGVSFSVGRGEMVAVVGASGAGKSTLLHTIGGLEAADDGDVRLGGLDVRRASGAELAGLRNREIGFVFQSHHLLLDLTAEENVALPLVIARKSFAEARARATELLDRVGLKERAAHGVGELSGGEQQRVAIARALVNRPRLLLADEPTGDLDARTGGEVGALLFSLCRAHQLTVIVATHNEGLARMCDRALRLQDGRLDESAAGGSPLRHPSLT